ncbi:MAG: ETC complex I subunit [Pseudomonadota bacterium]
MKTRVRIYKPVKNTMQSGRGGHQQQWVLEGLALTPRVPEQLMGWISSEDTNNQIRLKFDSKEAAIAFAESKGWVFDVEERHDRKVKPRNYLDNFKYRPVEYQPDSAKAAGKGKAKARPATGKKSSATSGSTKRSKKA